MADAPDPEPDEPVQHISAEKARGGEIILRSRGRRAMFIGGLILLVLVLILLWFRGFY